MPLAAASRPVAFVSDHDSKRGFERVFHERFDDCLYKRVRNCPASKGRIPASGGMEPLGESVSRQSSIVPMICWRVAIWPLYVTSTLPVSALALAVATPGSAMSLLHSAVTRPSAPLRPRSENRMRPGNSCVRRMDNTMTPWTWRRHD